MNTNILQELKEFAGPILAEWESKVKSSEFYPINTVEDRIKQQNCENQEWLDYLYVKKFFQKQGFIKISRSESKELPYDAWGINQKGEKVYFEIKNRTFRSTTFNTSFLSKKKLDSLNKLAENNHVILVYLFPNDETMLCWNIKKLGSITIKNKVVDKEHSISNSLKKKNECLVEIDNSKAIKKSIKNLNRFNAYRQLLDEITYPKLQPKKININN